MMDEGPGTQVRHSWDLKSHPFSACRVLASSGSSLTTARLSIKQEQKRYQKIK